MTEKGELMVDSNRPELGHVAKWTLSSHKYGFGVENLRDDDINTFWQYALTFSEVEDRADDKIRRSSTTYYRPPFP